ncbi:MAG: c-type cytochrome [Caldimicrobium sp.]|nr:c-type cytochrome [Caldimicrobium sp.]MDW8094824.1 c-type cytochrome [Caldimicrobium sp.]
MAQEGEALFKSKGCAGCHSKGFDTFAPSLKTISKSYRNKRINLINYLRGKTPGIIHRESKTMKSIINNVTKHLSDKELEALINYLLSH